MARITCRTPSTGKPLSIQLANVSDELTVIAEAPDFSIPDPSNRFTTRDPVDDSRAIRPGEIFFLTPLTAKNKGLVDATIEVLLTTEDELTIQIGKLEIPAGDTGFIPLQGRSILKRNPEGTFGGRIQVRASIPSVFDVWVSAEERLSSEHS